MTLVLRCPLEVCLDRIRVRHAGNPTYYDPPEVFTETPKIVAVWEYLARLDRPDARSVDATRPLDDVYADVLACVAARRDSRREGPNGG